MTIIKDVPCTVCGCVCDDLRISVDGTRIVHIENGCYLSEPWFSKQTNQPRIEQDVDALIAQAAAILSNAKYPLIYGLSRSSTEAQREAVALAERIGATIDTTASTGHAPSIVALQQVGESTCTLGEVKNRADLVIYFGCDPVTTHPRHIERYVPNDATIISIHSKETETSRVANQYFQVEADGYWEFLWTLRRMIRGHPCDELAARLKSAKFGIVFFGDDVVRGPMAHQTVEALLQLVTDLNAHTRFYARRLRRAGDVAGADSVLAWQTGFPFGVNFARGYPRYNPDEFTGPEMLARKEVDAVLFLGSECVSDFPSAAVDHLKTIPVIRIDSPGTHYPYSCDVAITTAVYGIHRRGTAYRMDEVPLPLPMLLASDLPSDADVLSRIAGKIA